MEPIFKRAVIAGAGLIGGSLAAAGKKAGLFGHVTGLGRGKPNLEKALELGLVDEITTDVNKAADGADLFFAATPVESIVPLCVKASETLADGAVITDGGSVKSPIVAELERILPAKVHFVGGHPVAGTEKSGAEAAFDTLYKNRYTILTPTADTNEEALGKVKAMWEGAGADVVLMTPAEHDSIMALISHLPHFAAFGLVEAINDTDREGTARKFVAGGFKDTTRIAASDPKMWTDIFAMNKGPLLETLRSFENSLAAFRADIEKGDFENVQRRLETVKAARLSMRDHCD